MSIEAKMDNDKQFLTLMQKELGYIKKSRRTQLERSWPLFKSLHQTERSVQHNKTLGAFYPIGLVITVAYTLKKTAIWLHTKESFSNPV